MTEQALATRAKVELMGRHYTLKGDVDPEYMVTLARYVDSKIAELKQLAQGQDPLRLALLVSLNLADELFQERHNHEGQPFDQEQLSRLEEKARGLITMLEKGIIGEPVH